MLQPFGQASNFQNRNYEDIDLYIVKSMIELHGSRLILDCKPG